MNLHHLAVFKAIAETQGVSAAAERLHITQPAISHQLKELEDRLGVVLFDRLPRGMRLTDVGEMLFVYARKIFALAESAETAVRDVATLTGGHIALGASNTVGTYLLPTVLAEFRKRHPGIELSLEISNTESIALAVSEHRLVIGLIEGPLSSDEFELREFYRDEIIAVVSPDHPLAGKRRISLKTFAKESLLIREEGSGSRFLIEEAFSRRGFSPKHGMEIGSAEATKRMVMAGGGIACLSRLCVSAELEQGQLVALDVPDIRIHRPFNIIQLKSRHIGPSAEAFMQTLAAVLSSSL